MKKILILCFVMLFFSHTGFANNPEEILSKDAVLGALVDPNSETDEFSSTRVNAPYSFEEYESVYISKNLKIIPKKKNSKSIRMHYAINTIYPKIAGGKLNEAEKNFNTRAKAIVDEEMNSFINSVKLDLPHLRTLPKEIRHNTFKIDYDIDVVHEISLVSVRFTIQGMQAGRAHPYRAHRVLNFDLAKNKELKLKDLFKPNSKFLKKLSELSSKQLKNIVGTKDQWMITEGTKPTYKNFKNWNIEKDSLLITFDEYQVAPYYYGPQEIEISYQELLQLLSKDAEVIASLKDEKVKIG